MRDGISEQHKRRTMKISGARFVKMQIKAMLAGAAGGLLYLKQKALGDILHRSQGRQSRKEQQNQRRATEKKIEAV